MPNTATDPISERPRGTSHLREMSLEECWEHLATRSVGRMAYNDRHGPVVVPLNYLVADGRIWIRTASYDDLAVHLPDQQAAFEVDSIDEHAHAGWSVLLRGRAEHQVVGRDHPASTWPDPDPWPDGVRRMTFCLDPREVTGRVLRQGTVGPAGGHGPGSIQRR